MGKQQFPKRSGRTLPGRTARGQFVGKRKFHRCWESRKRRFPDRQSAKEALTTIAFNKRLAAPVGGNPHRQEKRCYFCPRCHGWHLTSLAA